MDGEYVELDIDNVGFWDLCGFLLHKKNATKTFIQTHDHDKQLDGTLCRRFLICLSILFIGVLKRLSRCMERSGIFIEEYLNLWSEYGSFYMLVFNTLRGKNKKICRESPNFSSMVGLTDTRVELDDEISHDDPRYTSALAIMAAKTAYENEARVKKIVEDHWKMEFVEFFNCSNAYEMELVTEKQRPTQAFMFIDKTGDHDVIYISFRGTQPLSANDWCTDLDFSWLFLPGIGKVHLGFMKALGLQRDTLWPKDIIKEHTEYREQNFAYYKIKQLLREKIEKNNNTRFIITGHSLGGALAALFPAVLGLHNESKLLERLDGVYTFGQPRVGDNDLCRYMEDLLGDERYFRFVYANDVIPRVPFDDSDFRFKHFGKCYYFNSFYKGEVMKEVPNKNFFWPVSVGQVYLNAVFELVRSAMLPHAFGRKYKEGILLLGVRLVGLVFPGISAHCPQDYVNLTRLGNPNIFYNKIINQEKDFSLNY